MLALGADPDLHQAAYVLLDEHDVIHAYGCTRVPRRIIGPTAVGHVIEQLATGAAPIWSYPVGIVMVEGQEFYAQSPVDANDLIVLAQVTGAMAQTFRCQYINAFHAIPRPRDWRNIPKQADQRRIKHRIAQAFVAESDGVNAEFLADAHSHLLDAAGIAMFAHSDRGKAYLARMRALWRA